MSVVRVEKEIAGRVMVLETGRVAKQSHGAVWVQYGDTVVLATVLAGAVARLLFQVDPRDPLIFGTTGLLLVAVGLAAMLVPALRAAREDPVDALREA